jgi:hypothetical protein
MEFKVSGNNVVIKMPIDTLVMAFNHKEDNQGSYEVKYRRKFAEGLCKYLENHGDSETGLTAFQQLLDELFFDEMVSDGEDYIKELEEPEY